MKRREFLLCGSATAMGNLAGCAGGPSAGGGGQDDDTAPGELSEDELIERANPPEKIVITNFPVTGRVHYAVNEGFFEKRELNVQFTKQPVFGGSANMTALVSKKAHVATNVTITAPINLAAQQDTFVKLLRPTILMDMDAGYKPGTWMVGGEGIDEVADLEGKRIAVHRGGGGISPIGARWIVEQAGLDPSTDIELTQMPLDQIIGSVARGDVAAGNTIEPRVVIAENKDMPITRLGNVHPWFNPGFFTGHWVRPDFVEKRFTLELMRRSFADVHQDLDKKEPALFETISSITGTEKGILLEAFENGFLGKPVLSVDNNVMVHSLETMQDMSEKYNPEFNKRITSEELVLPW